MILDRLLVRHKLTLLIAVPLVTVALLLTVLLSGEVGQARAAGQTAVTADAARQVSVLVEEVQRARLLTVAYLDAGLVSAEAVDVQFAAVSDTRAQVLRDLGPDADPVLRRAVKSSEVVTELGALVLRNQGIGRGVTTDRWFVGMFNSVTDDLITSLRLDQQPAAQAQQAQQAQLLSALGALLEADEAASLSGALVLMAADNPAIRSQALTDAVAAQGLGGRDADAFGRVASPVQLALFEQATQGAGAQHLAEATAEIGFAGAGQVQNEVSLRVFAAVQSQTTLRQLVESSIAQEISSASRQASRAALIRAALLVGLGLALLVGVVLLSLVVGRSVAVPLRRLTDAAGSVADVADEELANVTDDDAGTAAVRRLPALPVGSRDELGELAAAFNRVQAATWQLLERQIVGRRNVAAMFAGIGRRTSNLVGRQLALIDALEGAEEDSRTLGTLYRLDHLSTRLRRNASSLVVLSGAREVVDEVTAISLPDAVRGALGSIEDFQRVVLSPLPDVHLSPAVIADFVLIVSELVENGVLFSPPHTSVEVGAWVTEDSRYALTVVDHGIGMPPHRLAEENARLRQRERLDLAPSDVLGLFVVGRISRRHGIDVTLIGTPGGGVTARVVLPATLFVDNPWSGATTGYPRADRTVDAPANGRRVDHSPVDDAADRGWRTPGPVATQPRAAQLPGEQPAWTYGGDTSMTPEPEWASGTAVSSWFATQPVEYGVPRQPDVPQQPDDPQPPDGVQLPPGIRRRVPGTHWEGPVPVTGSSPADPAEFPFMNGNLASRDAGIRDGALPGPKSGAAPRLPDPELTRRQVEELEAVLAGLDLGLTGAPPGPEAGEQLAPWPDQVTSWDHRRAAVAPPGSEQHAREQSPDGSQRPPWPERESWPERDPGPERESWPEREPWPEPSAPPGFAGEGLVRRVPGATLAALGAVLPEAATPASSSRQPVPIDADETLQAILDVDEAVRRARAQGPSADGYWATDDAVSPWGGREDGGGR